MKNLFVAALLTLGLSAAVHASSATDNLSQVTVSSSNCVLTAVILDSGTVPVSGTITLGNKAYGSTFSVNAYSVATVSFGVPHHFNNDTYILQLTGKASSNGSTFFCSTVIQSVNTCPKPGTDAQVTIMTSQIPGQPPRCVISAL